MKPPRNRKPAPQVRSETLQRTTAMTEAFLSMLSKQGVDASGASVPTKRESAWRVTRRKA